MPPPRARRACPPALPIAVPALPAPPAPLAYRERLLLLRRLPPPPVLELLAPAGPVASQPVESVFVVLDPESEKEACRLRDLLVLVAPLSTELRRGFSRASSLGEAQVGELPLPPESLPLLCSPLPLPLPLSLLLCPCEELVLPLLL